MRELFIWVFFAMYVLAFVWSVTGKKSHITTTKEIWIKAKDARIEWEMQNHGLRSYSSREYQELLATEMGAYMIWWGFNPRAFQKDETQLNAYYAGLRSRMKDSETYT